MHMHITIPHDESDNHIHTFCGMTLSDEEVAERIEVPKEEKEGCRTCLEESINRHNQDVGTIEFLIETIDMVTNTLNERLELFQKHLQG